MVIGVIILESFASGVGVYPKKVSTLKMIDYPPANMI